MTFLFAFVSGFLTATALWVAVIQWHIRTHSCAALRTTV